MTDNHERGADAGDIDRPLCFVIMPFTSAQSRVSGCKYRDLGKNELDTVFALLTRILHEDGYNVRRSDGVGDILRDLVLDLDRAELVCADLTGLNPNVMYELGIRHGFAKKTILLTQDMAELPFDLRAYHAIEYGWITLREQQQLAAVLRETIARIRADPDARFGPVHSHLGAKTLAIQDSERRATLRKLSALCAELLHMWRGIAKFGQLLPGIIPHGFADTPQGTILDLEKVDVHAHIAEWAAYRAADWAMAYPTIDLFVSTQYIDDRFNQHGDISAFTGVLASFRIFLHDNERSLGNFLALRNLLEIILSDVETIENAVRGDAFGVDLRLKAKTEHDRWMKATISQESEQGGGHVR